MSKTIEADFITVLDAPVFYSQWLSHSQGRWAMTIATGKGLFTPNQGSRNSNAYAQIRMSIFFSDVLGPQWILNVRDIRDTCVRLTGVVAGRIRALTDWTLSLGSLHQTCPGGIHNRVL